MAQSYLNPRRIAETDGPQPDPAKSLATPSGGVHSVVFLSFGVAKFYFSTQKAIPMANENKPTKQTSTNTSTGKLVPVQARPETIVINGLSAEDDVKSGESLDGSIMSHTIREVNGKKEDNKNEVYSLIQGQMRTTSGRVIPVDLSAFNGSHYDKTATYTAFKSIRTDDKGKVRHSYVVMPK